LRDIQSESDSRKIDIDRVGIKDITYPVILEDRAKGRQHTVAKINMFVHLPHRFKGTHMSRFVEILNRHRENISLKSVDIILDEMCEKLESEESHIDLYFKYFIERKAPVSKQAAIMDYECSYSGANRRGSKDFVLTVKVPVQTVCPCSKEISEFGAHNQRGYVNISARFEGMLWIEELIEIAENSGSSPVYPLLKREDEKYVTEVSYENPAFVEDVVRNIAEKLNSEERITWYQVTCENMESIHNHSAYAVVEKDKS